MVAQEALLSPQPVEQLERYTMRDLPLRLKSEKRSSSASALSKEMATAFGSSADGLDLQNSKFGVDDTTVSKRSGGFDSRTTIASNTSLSDSKESMRSNPGSIKQAKPYPATEGRYGSAVTWGTSPMMEPEFIPIRLRPETPRLVIATNKANSAAIAGGKKTPRSARYETVKSSSKPRHPRLQHERNSAEDSDSSSVDLYHKATGELARDQKAAERLVKATHFPYSSDSVGSHDDTDSDNDSWHRNGNFLSPPPPRSMSSSRQEQRFSPGSDVSHPNPDCSRDRPRQVSVHTFGGGIEPTPSPPASSRLSEQTSPKPSSAAAQGPRPTSKLLNTITASTINDSTSGISSELLLGAIKRNSSQQSPRNRHSSILSKVLFNRRISGTNPPATPANITPTPAPTPISPSFNDMPLLNLHQAQQVQASLPPMNSPLLSESSPSTLLGGLSLAFLAQKTKAITSARFKKSEDRRRAKLKSKIRVFGDGGTVLGLSEKGVEVVGVRKPGPETEQRRGAGGNVGGGYDYLPILGVGSVSSGSSESFGGTITPTGTGKGGMVFGKEITDSTGPEMRTRGRFGPRAGAGKGQGQQQQQQGLVRPFAVPAAGQMERRKSPARQQYGPGLDSGIGGQVVLSPPPQPPPTKALPHRPGQQTRLQENTGAKVGDAGLGQFMNLSTKSEGSGLRGNGVRVGGGGALVDARGNVMFPVEQDGVRPVL
ncbi:hypothetical protein QBC43DRAFT_108291 [Cladorrhinum sp. PSN259]|nr:hypothetical protein QBC43DRAFT_108291 [Cladorrhinum sp. PSN259]